MEQTTIIDLRDSGFIDNEKSWEKLSEDIYAVLLGRTDGELHRKVVNAGSRADAAGHKDGGAKAYMQVYAWFMESTGLNCPRGEQRG